MIDLKELAVSKINVFCNAEELAKILQIKDLDQKKSPCKMIFFLGALGIMW